MSTDESVRAPDADDAAPEPSPRRGGARRKARREARADRKRSAATAEVTQVPEAALAGAPTDVDLDEDEVVAEAPRFWHRDHPVFTPLAGFFTGVLTVIVVLGLLGAILDLVGFDISESPWVFLVALGVLLAANLVLVVVEGTRRFARYMLFGILTTPAVVAAVASLTFWILLSNDR